jgi:hypothetical protein
VALDRECFGDPMAPVPTNCVWLDSQASVEGNIPSSFIFRTEILATCPLVTFAGKPVPSK